MPSIFLCLTQDYRCFDVGMQYQVVDMSRKSVVTMRQSPSRTKLNAVIAVVAIVLCATELCGMNSEISHPKVSSHLVVDSSSIRIVIDIEGSSDTTVFRVDYWMVCLADYPKCGNSPYPRIVANTLSIRDRPFQTGTLSQTDFLIHANCTPMFIRVMPGARTHLEIGVPSNEKIRSELVANQLFLITLPYWKSMPKQSSFILRKDSSEHNLLPQCGDAMVDGYFVEYSCSPSDPEYVQVYGVNWFTDPNIVHMIEAQGSVVKASKP